MGYQTRVAKPFASLGTNTFGIAPSPARQAERASYSAPNILYMASWRSWSAEANCENMPCFSWLRSATIAVGKSGNAVAHVLNWQMLGAAAPAHVAAMPMLQKGSHKEGVSPNGDKLQSVPFVSERQSHTARLSLDFELKPYTHDAPPGWRRKWC